VSGERAPSTGGEETRRRILAVSVELFAGQGYAGTSIRDIAGRAGLTKAALYYHFASKEEILDAVIAPLGDELDALLLPVGGRPPGPAALLAGMVDVLSRRIAVLHVVMSDPSADRPPHRRLKFREQMGRLEAALAGDGGTDDLIRARCALGAVQVGCFATVAAASGDHPRLAAPLDEAGSTALLEGSEHLLTEEQRATIVAAARRALGRPRPTAATPG
jgi:AcrR family transcriptional regulator